MTTRQRRQQARTTKKSNAQTQTPSKQASAPEWVPVSRASTETSLSVDLLYRSIRKGEFGPGALLRVGTAVRIRRSALDAWLADRVSP